MIDYIKILIINIDVERLVYFTPLKFDTYLSTKTGEISPKMVAKHHFCKIKVLNETSVLFTGSIHKFWNSLHYIKAHNQYILKFHKGFNGNTFTIDGIIEVRAYLCKLFDCKPKQMLFQNIEFGVNVPVSFEPELYIKGILYHKNKLFDTRYQKSYFEVFHQRYNLKIYNKSKQYKMKNNVLRIEVKIKKTIELKKTNIVTFADITTETLERAKELLLARFDEIMHFDYTIFKSKLTDRQKQSLKDYSRPHFWIDEVRPIHRDRHKKRLRNFTNDYSNNLHQQIKLRIIKECVIINKPKVYIDRVIFNLINSNLKGVINTTSNMGLMVTNSIYKDYQIKELYNFNSNEGKLQLKNLDLKDIYFTNRKLYDEIKEKYQKVIKENSSLDSEVMEIVKYIKRINRKQENLYTNQQLLIFNLFE